MKNALFAAVIAVLLTAAAAPAAAPTDARQIIDAAWRHFRGLSSEATIEMVIHRPEWERRMTMSGWTKGDSLSLIRITAPAKDRDNGTLKKGRDMWTYNPRINRVIKLPPSLMAQAWMGSDFSNNDLAKSDSILNDYRHELTGTETHEGKTVYVIRATPRPDAPVVWGRQVLKIREDHVLLSEEFFDEDMVSVKLMTCSDIRMMGGRLFPRVWKMRETGKKERYTLLIHEKIAFLDDLPNRLFTVTHLKEPLRR